MKIKFGDNSLNLKVDGSLANIDRGPRGYSAYEIAVQEGFVGTEEEWLASLVGPEGKQGKDGERGIQGPRGQQGDKGEKGDTGPQGEKGEKGDTGPQGEKGEKGDTGPQGETGATGNGILSIQKTATAGLVDTYTTTFTDGTTTTFDVTNGEDGEVTQAQLDESQAKQDTKIDWLQTLVDQMPTVSGQGTDLSLESVLNYRLMKFLPQGTSSQDGEPTSTTPIPVKSVTGENSVKIQNKNLVDINNSEIGKNIFSSGVILNSNNHNTTDYIYIGNLSSLTISFTSNASVTWNICFFDKDKNVISGGANGLSVSTGASGYTKSLTNKKYIRFSYPNDAQKLMLEGFSSKTTYVEHEEQNYLITLKSDNLIGLDTAQYPVDLKVGDKITLTNNDNVALQLNFYTNFGDSERNDYWTIQPRRSRTVTVTNDSKAIAWNRLFSGLAWVNKGETSLSYKPYIANPIELNSSPDGTIRDEIVGTPNNWFKREYIGKVVLDGSENWTFYSSSIMKFALNVNGINKPATQDTLPNILSDKFKQSTWNNAISSDNYLMAVSTSNEILRIKDNDFSNLADFKAWLSTHNATIYYPLAQYTDIPITDTTLINQLNDIYNNAHSYNGVTNITTTYEDGNEQMYLDIEALAKGGSTTTETDPIFSASASSGITSSDITNWNGKASTTYVDTAIATAITNTLGGSY